MKCTYMYAIAMIVVFNDSDWLMQFNHWWLNKRWLEMIWWWIIIWSFVERAFCDCFVQCRYGYCTLIFFNSNGYGTGDGVVCLLCRCFLRLFMPSFGCFGVVYSACLWSLFASLHFNDSGWHFGYIWFAKWCYTKWLQK